MPQKRFLMRWPELGKEVRVEPIHHNQELFDWFLENLPTKCVQTLTVVAGLGLYMQNVPMPNVPCNWIQENQPMEDISQYPSGRFMFFMTAGNVSNMVCKVSFFTEPLPYPTWAEVIEEDKQILNEVGWEIWESLLMEKKTYHVEFLRVEG